MSLSMKHWPWRLRSEFQEGRILLSEWQCFCCLPSLQYWYEGDESGDLPVDFSIVWDGDFFIDKPMSMKGKDQHNLCLMSLDLKCVGVITI